MALTSDFLIRAICNFSNALDLSTPADALDYSARIQLATGTGANQADLVFHDRRTLTASATEDLDVAGILTSPLGTTLTMVRVKALIVKAASTNTNNVNLTRPASNGVPIFLAASDGIAIRPGGAQALIAPDATGYPVTAGTGDLITFTNSAGSTSVTYDVIIVGASA